MSKISRITLPNGTTYDIGGVGGEGMPLIEITREEYDKLSEEDKLDEKLYCIINEGASDPDPDSVKNIVNNIWENQLKPEIDSEYVDKTTLESHIGNGDVHVTAQEKAAWNDKSNFSGNYADLSGTPTLGNLAEKSTDGSTVNFLRGDGTWATPPDNNTTYGTVSKSGAGLCPALPNETTTTKYLRQDGSWVAPPNTTYSAGSNITQNGTTFSLTKANVTNALGYTPPTSDTNTWRGIQNNLTSTSTTDSLSAYQGKLLNDGKQAKITVGGVTTATFSINAYSSKEITWTCPSNPYNGKQRTIVFVAINGVTLCSVNSCGYYSGLTDFAWINNNSSATASGTLYIQYLYW